MGGTGIELAQTNIATLHAPVDDPMIADFVNALDRINALAESMPGFVWRLTGDGNDATDVVVDDDHPLTILNLSVWASRDALFDYVYRTEHRDFLRRRGEWFVSGSSRFAMWWLPSGEHPTEVDAVMRCDFIDRYGPSPFAFWFRDSFPALTVERRPLDDPDAQRLIAELDAELLSATPEGGTNFFGVETNEINSHEGGFLIAYLDGSPVGCVAYRRIVSEELPPDTVEIKRMYVDPSARGHKIGAALLASAEHRARLAGYREARLETGPYLAAAVSLYEGAGYEICEPWDDYRCARESVCYRRRL